MLLRSQLASAAQSSAGSKKFGMSAETVDGQMARLDVMKRDSPKKAFAIVQLNETLVSLAGNGELQKFVTLVSECDEDMLLFYFIVKMYKASLVGGYFVITKYMVDMGYPVGKATLPDVLHECLFEVEDYRGSEIAEFLHSNKCDLNRQQKGSYLSPLHIAVRRDMAATVQTLIRLGADVNSVAGDDLMPLLIAKTINLQSEQTEAITKLLEANGARVTWRRDGEGGGGGAVPFVSQSDAYTSLYTRSSTKNCNKPTVDSSSPADGGVILRATGFAGGGGGISLQGNPAFVSVGSEFKGGEEYLTAVLGSVSIAEAVSCESEDGDAFLFSTG